MAKYLDQAGVEILWAKTKEKIVSEIGNTAPKAHTHVIGDITNLQTILDSKSNNGHTHTVANITDWASELDKKLDFDGDGYRFETSGGAIAMYGGTSSISVSDDYFEAWVDHYKIWLDSEGNFVYEVDNEDIYDVLTTKNGYTKSEIDNELGRKLNTSLKGTANGVASLDANGKVPSSQLPSYVDDVLEFANKTAFPASGESGKIYVANDTNLTYRWSGTAYVEISSSLALGETASTAYAGNKGKQNADNIASLQTTKADKSYVDTELGKKANTSHAHTIAQIVSLQDTLNTKLNMGSGGKGFFDEGNMVRVEFNGKYFFVDRNFICWVNGDHLFSMDTEGVLDLDGKGLLDTSMALTTTELNAILV